MKIIVLGSAAGGGFPQWNCNCHNCAGLRAGTLRATARTQSSIAVSVDGVSWLLVNASPDILAQIKANPALQPARAVRDTGITAVMLMDAQIDHVTGLLMLRESRTKLPLYCTASVWDDLTTGLPLVNVLSHYCGVQWQPIAINDPSALAAPIKLPSVEGITVTPLALKSKAPPYSPHRENPQPGDNIGLLIRNDQTGKQVFYAPGLGEIEPHVMDIMRQSDCVLVDGTFWTEDEMVRAGLSKKMAADMGHLPQSGEGGMIDVLDGLATQRKILIHINNTNPILNEESPERATLAAHRIEVAYDGMEIAL